MNDKKDENKKDDLEITKGVEEKLDSEELVLEEELNTDDYVGTQTVYQCSECDEQIIVKEGDPVPTKCKICEADMHIADMHEYDKQEDLSVDDSGDPESRLLQDEVTDTDEALDSSDENTGNISDVSELDEPEIVAEEELVDLEDVDEEEISPSIFGLDDFLEEEEEE